MKENENSLLPVVAGSKLPAVIEAVQPWKVTVNGAQLFAAIATLFNRFLFLADGVSDAIALWVGHVWCVNRFRHSPRLAFCSAESGSGKSVALDLLHCLAPNPVLMDCPSEASLCRFIHHLQPTLLLDETDNWLGNSKGITSLLNSGHRQGPARVRCFGAQVRTYYTYGPVALAGLGELPTTLQTRSLVVRMLPPKPGEEKEAFDILNCAHAKELGQQLARWAIDNADALSACDPKLPSDAVSRLADNWRPLFAIAEVLGGEWIGRANAAFNALKAESSEELSAGKMLLRAIQTILETKAVDRIASKDVVVELAKLEDPIAQSGRRARGLTAQDIAQMLRPYRIKPCTVECQLFFTGDAN
jgi:putative DNA primase/helicase